MNFKCEICDKEFDKKWKLERHSRKKIACIPQKHFQEKVQEQIIELSDKVDNINQQLNILLSDHNETTHQCSYCNKTFNIIYNLTKHLKICKKRHDNISIYERELGIHVKNDDNLNCRYCNKDFTKQSAASRHKNTCKHKYIYELELQKKVLEKRKVAATTNTINNFTNNNNNIHNGHNIHIHMNPFGKENLDFVTTKMLIKELQQCKLIQDSDISSIVKRFTKLIHANPAHPENQNVLIKSLNNNYAKVYRENGFQLEEASDVTETIFQNVQKLVQQSCDEYDYDNGSSDFADLLDNIDEKYEKINENLTEGNSSKPLHRCKSSIKAALYTESNNIESTQKLIQQ